MTDKRERQEITQKELAELLYYFVQKYGIEFADHEMKKDHSLFKTADKANFARERIILIIWIIDKFFSDKERKLTASVHKEHLIALGILNNETEAKKEILSFVSRYKEYYDAWDEKSADQSILSGVIAKNIFQDEKLSVNALITSYIVGDIYALKSHLEENIFNKYVVTS